MIVGTAGHIDHGKTTLVRALTGVDTDRLPEEKKRGISIELGYAYLEGAAPGDARIGFIDVPGHERLVATMLAGATGIDYALLLVAADDGVMPQTREHLAVLSLLGVRRGAVVVTKADRVDAARLVEVGASARALVAGSGLDGVPIVEVSASDGRGIEVLRELIVTASRLPGIARDPGAGFRLAIDRVFTLAGVGTVVTGTAHAGEVAIGDELCLAPSVGERRVRVRSLHAQNVAVARARAGERVALGIVGIDKDDLARGDCLVDPRVALSSSRLDALVEVWPGEAKAIRSGAIVHVHVGASDTLASLAVLAVAEASPRTGDAIAPGAAGFVQLVLRRPMAAWRGDRVVLRDASATRTIGGGIVLDPFAPARYRRTPQRLAMLHAASLMSPRARLSSLLEAAPDGIDLDAWRRAEGRIGDDAAAIAVQADVDADGHAIADAPADADEGADPDARGGPRPRGAQVVARRDGGTWALGAEHAATVSRRIVAALDDFHRDRPDEAGPDAGRLRRLVAPRMAEALWRELLARSVATGVVDQRGSHFALPGHAARVSAADQRIVERLLPRLLEGGFDPPWVRSLAADAREPEALVRAALLRAAQRGELHQVVKDLYYPPPTLARAAALVRDIAGREGAVSAAAFRDASGLGRKRAVQIVEYFDRVGLLRRVGDVHRLRADCELFGTSTADS